MKHRLLPLFAVGLTLITGPLHAEPEPMEPVAVHWRALSRFGYGPDPNSLHPAQPQGKAWALAELHRALIDSRRPAALPAGLEGFAAPLPQLFAQDRADEAQRRATLKTLSPGDKPPQRFSGRMAEQAADWRLLACSNPSLESPLLARMTEFWFNHLNVSADKGSARPFVGHYVVHAIRPHALGRYEDLLLASAQHPAMLHYLDQARSVAEGSGQSMAGQRAQGLNENYARELMELHTLGVNGGYTQNDVRELARILTGWTTDPESPTGFRFLARRHDGGEKRLLGQRVPANGLQEGEDAIRRLARHPATAQRIGLRLAQWFVADEPPPALVQKLAQRFLETQGDIAAVMHSLIESPQTWQPEHQLFKTPLDYTCSVLTALGGTPDERLLQQAQRFLKAAGQPLQAWPTPDGYKTDAPTWLSPEALSRRADVARASARQSPHAQTLAPWLPATQWARIRQEPAAQHAGLALASPAFMRK